MRVGPMGPSPDSLRRYESSLARAFRSKPAQKFPSAPVSTATARESSASKRRNASASPLAVGPSTALRTSGRSMVTVTTAPSTSYLTRGSLERAPLVVVFHERIAVIRGRHVGLFDDARADPPNQVEERARLVIGPRRACAAEWLQADDGARWLVVDVEVARRV